MQETRLCRSKTRSWEGCQEFCEQSGYVCQHYRPSEESLNASKIAPVADRLLSLLCIQNLLRKTIFATKCLMIALLCAKVVPHCVMYYIPANATSQFLQLQGTKNSGIGCCQELLVLPRLFPLRGEKWSENEPSNIPQFSWMLWVVKL